MKKFILVMLLLSVGLLAACTPAVVEEPVVDEPVVEEPAYVLIHNPFTDYGIDLQSFQIKFFLYVEQQSMVMPKKLGVKQVSAHLVEEVRLYPNGVIEIHFVPDPRIYVYISEPGVYTYTVERVDGYVYTSTDHVGYGWGLTWFGYEF